MVSLSPMPASGSDADHRLPFIICRSYQRSEENMNSKQIYETKKSIYTYLRNLVARSVV
jgi:hypothetical protein